MSSSAHAYLQAPERLPSELESIGDEGRAFLGGTFGSLFLMWLDEEVVSDTKTALDEIVLGTPRNGVHAAHSAGRVGALKEAREMLREELPRFIEKCRLAAMKEMKERLGE